MKKDKITILLIFIFIIGFSVMLYPFVSDYVNSQNQSKAIASYDSTVKTMSSNSYDVIFREAEEYNEKLSRLDNSFLEAPDLLDYAHVLDISGTGIMGYVTIEKLRVELPIYHGTSVDVLQVAAGHLEGSSFPVGGRNTHAVVSAHRGLPSAKLFTDLDRLEKGDIFTITVLNRRMTYEVSEIRIVYPDEVDTLKIQPGKDLVTLMTCTPYGINTQRLLVTGTRIGVNDPANYVPLDAYQINTSLVAIILTAIFMIIIAIVSMIVEYRKKN